MKSFIIGLAVALVAGAVLGIVFSSDLKDALPGKVPATAVVATSTYVAVTPSANNGAVSTSTSAPFLDSAPIVASTATETSPTNFHGPTTPPHAIGPTGPPPSGE